MDVAANVIYENVSAGIAIDFMVKHPDEGVAFREGWNGKGQHVFLCSVSSDITPEGHKVFALVNSHGKMQLGWVPSQGDLLANDWTIAKIVVEGEE